MSPLRGLRRNRRLSAAGDGGENNNAFTAVKLMKGRNSIG